SDHMIADSAQFEADCLSAAKLASEHVVVFGIPPVKPATEYGYIESGEPLASGKANKVTRFVEKPDMKSAQGFLKEGYLWNSGNLLFAPDLMLSEIRAIVPRIDLAARRALENAQRKGGALVLPTEGEKPEG